MSGARLVAIGAAATAVWFLILAIVDILKERARWNRGQCPDCGKTYGRLARNEPDGSRRYICGCPKLVTHISWPVDR